MQIVASNKLIAKKTKAPEALSCTVKYSYDNCRVIGQKILN